MVDSQFKVVLKEPAPGRFVKAMSDKSLLSEAGIEYIHFLNDDQLLIIGTDEMNIASLVEFLAFYCEPVTNIGLITQTIQWEPEWDKV